MTQNEFNHLLSSIKVLSPEQMRQLRQQLDGELAHHDPHAGAQLKKPPAQTVRQGSQTHQDRSTASQEAAHRGRI